jgi:serine protease Do
VRGTFGEVVEKLRRATVQVKPHRNGGGSGVIWSGDGQIITNAHVVEGAGRSVGVEVERVEIELWDGRRVPARIVKRDRRLDVAVLRVEASDLAAAAPGDSDALRVGELVIAVGNPLGFTGAASTGVVHCSNYWEDSRDRFPDRRWLVSQLRLAPGNSGGPLANARGEVVGINTMIAGGLAFAIPSRSIMEFLAAPVPAQGAAPAGLGVAVQSVPADPSGRGIAFIVLEIIPDSPAERASLLQGDILVGAGGHRFQSVQDFARRIHAAAKGILELQFRRGGSANIRTVAIRMVPASVLAA